MYKIILKKENELVSSSWSGGNTTQLAIYPQEASYSNRDFLWRLSSATVECEQSTFTRLPGFNRIILAIDGELTLIHNDTEKVCLNALESYRFNGSWNTKSFGKVKDFNLMYTDSCEGNVEVIEISDNKLEELKVIFDNNSDLKHKTVALYCAIGKVEVNFIGSEPLTINQGDVMIINLNEETDKVSMIMRNFMLKNSVLIKSEIKY